MQAIAPCITGVDTTEILTSEAQERKVANVISCGDGVMNCKTTAKTLDLVAPRAWARCHSVWMSEAN